MTRQISPEIDSGVSFPWLIRWVCVLSFFTVLALVQSYPLIGNFNDRIPGWPGDSSQFVWNQWWFHEAVFERGVDPLQCPLMFHPDGVDLSLHTFAPLRAGLGALIMAWIGPIPAFNLLFLASFVLCGAGMFALSRFLGLSTGASVLAGVIFSFSPFRTGIALGHMNVFSLEWLPWTLYWALRTMRRSSWSAAVITGLMLACTAATSLNLLVYTFLALVIFVGAECFRPNRRSGLIRLVVAAAVFLVLFMPLAWKIACAVRRDGLSLLNTPPTVGSIDLMAFLMPQPFHPFWYGAGAWYKAVEIGPKNCALVSIGWSVLLLAGIGLFSAMRTPGFRRIPLLGAFSLSLALGLSLRIAGRVLVEGPVMPFWWFLKIPLLRAAREPGRMTILITLSVALLAALAADRLNRRIPLITIMAIALVIFELTVLPFPLIDITPPAALNPMIADLSPGAVLQFPCCKVDPVQLLHQTAHGRAILAGKVARLSPKILQRYNEDPVLKYLCSLQDQRLRIDMTPDIRFRIVSTAGLGSDVTLLQLSHGYLLDGRFARGVVPSVLWQPGRELRMDGLVALNPWEMKLTPLSGTHITITTARGEILGTFQEPEAPWESRAEVIKCSQPVEKITPPAPEVCSQTMNRLGIRYILFPPGYCGSRIEYYLLGSLNLDLIIEADGYRLYQMES